MNLAQKIVSVSRTLVRGYKVETPVRGSRRAARRYLDEALNGRRPFDGLQVHYQIGLENWRYGKTLLVVRGDGSASVRNVARSEIKNLTGTLAQGEFRELIEIMSRQRFYEVDPVKTCSFADQSEIEVILVEVTQPDKFWVRVWENDVANYPGFAAVVAKMRDILKQVTGGAII